MNCARKGCTRVAVKQLRFVLINSGQKAEMILSLGCCKRHANDQTKQEIFEYGPGREQINAAFLANGNAPPEWDKSHAYWSDLVLPSTQAILKHGKGILH